MHTISFRDHDWAVCNMQWQREDSGQKGFIVYMGNEIFGAKWRNWKLHFKWRTIAPQQFNSPKGYPQYPSWQKHLNSYYRTSPEVSSDLLLLMNGVAPGTPFRPLKPLGFLFRQIPTGYPNNLSE